jgi:hypothetical protein
MYPKQHSLITNNLDRGIGFSSRHQP